VIQRQPAGWPLIAILGTTQIVGYGSVFYSFSLLMRPLQESVGAGKAAVVGAFSFALLVAAGCAVLVGKAIDRNGGRGVMAAGSALAGLSLAGLAHVETLPGLYLAYAGLGISMAAILYEPAFAVLTQAFGPNVRRAITALTLIAGFASTIFWPLTQYLIDSLGWRDAVLVLAALNLVVCFPLHLAALPPGERKRGAPGTDSADDRAQGLRQALRTPGFYLFAGTLVCNGLIFATMSVHMIPVLEAKGLSAIGAATLAALVGPMQVAGRVLEVTIGRRFPIARVGLVALWAMPIALLLLLAAGTGSWLLAAFAMIYGASNGVFTIVRGAMPVELFGRAHYGAINGALSAPYLVSHALGPTLAALLWTAFGGNYDGVVAALAAVGVTGALLFLATSKSARS
jgi:MFS family permease